MARDKAMHKLNRMNTCKSPIRPVYPIGHADVNIFMLTVAAKAAPANRLIPSTLPNVPFWSPKQAVLATKTGHIAAPNRPFHRAE